jgi:hypothetical protein
LKPNRDNDIIIKIITKAIAVSSFESRYKCAVRILAFIRNKVKD